MNKPNITSKQTFQMIPQEFTNVKVSLQAIYLYSKLMMLQNRWYSETTLGVNPISKETEIHQHYVSNYIQELYKLSFINVTKEQVDDKEYNRNIYEILPIKGYWQAVYNDFINLTTLNAKEKGFAILLSLYKDLPKSVNGISKLTGIDNKTVNKYIKRLKEESVLSDEFDINPVYFPNLQSEAIKQEYKNRLSELRKMNGNVAMQKKLDWVEKLTYMPYKWKIDKLTEIEMGLLGN